jgi:NAD(P)-dependent dehydrogenase (short-subunit alcohol dehydrogenase family)
MLQQIDAILRRVRSGTLPTAAGPGAPAAGALAGRVVIVTGAARGLGRAYTLELCQQGAAVVANDVDEAALKETVDATGATPGSAHAVVHDVSDRAAPRVLLDAALRRYGQVHGLVANAGLLRSGPILRLSDDDLRLLLDVHVTAPFRLLRVLGGYWRGEAKAGRGLPAAAVLTTSAAGLYGFRAEAAYSAAKAAVVMLAKVAADELGRYGTTVNAIAPAARTRLTTWLPDTTASPDDDPWAPEHVAPVVAWLLGPDAREITGGVIEVGNGQLSVPDGWRPGTPYPLPPRMSTMEANTLLPRVFAGAAVPPALLGTDMG